MRKASQPKNKTPNSGIVFAAKRAITDISSRLKTLDFFDEMGTFSDEVSVRLLLSEDLIDSSLELFGTRTTPPHFGHLYFLPEYF